VNFEIAARVDVYAGAPQASSAAKFGTLGINFRATRARTEAEWLHELSTLTCSA
jgi:hypothetical protein